MRVSPSLIGLAIAAALSSFPSMAAEPQKAEVIHWWTSGGEAAAVKVFADAYDKAGGQWVDSAIAGGGGEAARTAGINRIVGGNPPTMMQFNTGKQLDELVSNGYLANLDDAANAATGRIFYRSQSSTRRCATAIGTRCRSTSTAPIGFSTTPRFSPTPASPSRNLERRAGGRPQAEGQGRHPVRSWRTGLAGPSPVRRGSCGRRRLRSLSLRLWQRCTEGDREPRIQACRRNVQDSCAA